MDIAEHTQEEGVYVPLADVAQRQGISEKYLESIISLLSKAKLVVGVRGKGGGYRLSRAPEEYPLSDVLRITEGTLAPVGCLVCDDETGEESCDNHGACPTFPVWKGLDDAITSYLSGITVADLIHNDRALKGLTD